MVKPFDKMNMIKSVKEFVLESKSKLKENSIDSLLWIVNLVPNIAGFSLLKDKIFGLLIFYVKYIYYNEVAIKYHFGG